MKTTETIYRIVISLLIGIAGSRSAEAICFVNGAATGANTGSSWTDAYTNPQFALIHPGCTEIWVAKGVYKPTLGTDPNVSFVVSSGVTMYGGFVGGETTRDARSPVVNLTVLSGDIDDDDFNASGNGVDSTVNEINGTNSYHVMFLDGSPAAPITEATVIDGFTITGGNSLLPAGSVGGGLYCDGKGPRNVCSPTIKNVVFSGNGASGNGVASVGGAMYNNGKDGGASSPVLIDVTFIGNRAEGAGGAIYDDGSNDGLSNPTLTNVFFSQNSASTGGAMYSQGQGISDDGLTRGESNPVLFNVMFSGNYAATCGAMFNHSAGGGDSSPSLVNVTFTENFTPTTGENFGGALCNVAESADGLTPVTTSSPTLTNVTFNLNHALAGGAMYNGSAGSANTLPKLVNVTFSGNTSAVGGAIYNAGLRSQTIVSLKNVILWGDIATIDGNAEIHNDLAHATIDHSVVQGDCPTDPTIVCTNILTTDPKLAPLAENGNFTRTMLPGFGSSAIDAGLDSACPSTDQRAVTRPQGPHCEIGAVEVVVAPVPPTAVRESIVMYRNTTKQITLVGFDNNPGGPYTLTYAQATPVSHGSVSLVNEIATYTPAHDYIGLDSFTYTVTDVNGTSLPATVSINVLATPEAQPFEFTIPMNTTKSITLAASDATPAGAFTYATVDLPMHGSVTLVGDLATYTPATDYSGPDSYTYTATDGNGTSPPATVTIHVLPAKVPPVALPRAIVVPYNTSGTITFGATDSNPGGPFVYSFAKASLTTHGTLGVVESTHVVYVPTHNYSGPDSFTYTVTDVNGTSVPATVTITVLPAGGTFPGGTSAVPAVNALGLMLLSGLVGVFGMARRLR